MTLPQSPKSADYRPRLRPSVQPSATADPGRIALHDARRLAPGVVVVSQQALPLIRAFTGERTITELALATGSGLAAREAIMQLVEGLDQALLLQSDRFNSYVEGPTRLPSCLGCYPDDPGEIATLLNGLFTSDGGPGLPNVRTDSGTLRALLVPHMDYARGGVTYGWGFKELVEQSNAKLFFVIGTSHYSPHRFSLSRKNYQTPLGVVPTDQTAVDRIESIVGPSCFADPYAHLPEHSIELEVLLLQHLLGKSRPFRIVPLLVGSFQDCVDAGQSPDQTEEITQMVEALRQVEAEAHEEVCYLISGDLAHIGPKFQDPIPLDPERLQQSKTQDERLLQFLTEVDPVGYFQVIAAERDARNICGLPPTWVALSAANPRRARVLHYGRYVHPQGQESVSFAAAAFYQ